MFTTTSAEDGVVGVVCATVDAKHGGPPCFFLFSDILLATRAMYSPLNRIMNRCLRSPKSQKYKFHVG